MIGSALLLSINEELQKYLDQVGLAAVDVQSAKHTLRSMVLFFHTWSTKLKFLAYLVYNLDKKRGGEILTGIEFKNKAILKKK